MNALRWKSIAYAAAIFVVGGGTGACLALGLIRHPRGGPPRSAEMAQRMRETLRTELDLTPVQTKKIDPLVEKLGAEMRAIHIETMERVRKLIDSAHDQIAAELTPEQKRKLEAMERKRKQRFETMDRERHKFMREPPPFPFHRHGSKRDGEPGLPPPQGPQPGQKPGAPTEPPPPPPGG